MSQEFDAQRAFEALMDKIDDGFARLSQKMDEHAQDDSARFNSLGERISTVETKTNIVSAGLGAVLLSAVGAMFSWMTGK